MYGLGKRAFGSSSQQAKRRRTLNQTIREAQRQQYLAKNRRTGGLIDIEKKFFDVTVSNAALTANSWTDIPGGTISAPAQGDGAQERDGRVFFIHSLHVRGFIDVAKNSTGQAQEDILVRIVVVWDTQCNNAAVTPSEIYEQGPDLVNRLRNLEHSSRYIVLKDKLIRINRNVLYDTNLQTFYAQEQLIPFKFNKTFKKPIKVRTSGTTAAVGSITDNNITVLAGMNTGGDSTNVHMASRVRFTG